MPVKRNHLDSFAIIIMMLLCTVWGFQQVAIKLASNDISPTLQIGIRSAFAALVLLIIMLRTEGINFFSDGTLKAGIFVGIMFAIEFLFVGLGLEYTSASHMVVFLYTAPIFTAIGMHFVHPDEQLSLVQWIGVLLAFFGISLAFFGPQSNQETAWLGDFYALLAGGLWGLTTVTIRSTKLSEALPVKTLFYQMAVAALILIITSFLLGNVKVVWTPETSINMLFQIVVVAIASYLTWFWLLRKYLASRLATFTFITPLIGVIFGVLILNETLSVYFIMGGVLVFIGVFLVSAKDLFKRRKESKV